MDTEILHFLKDLAHELCEIKEMIGDLSGEHHGRIRIPHRCPVCNGSTYDEKEDALCLPCDGRGIVWG